jgi:hypothetical protein
MLALHYLAMVCISLCIGSAYYRWQITIYDDVGRQAIFFCSQVVGIRIVKFCLKLK